MSEVKQAKISDIQLDDHNANQGTQRGLGMLDSSLRKHGAGRSVLLDKNLKAIAGNKTILQSADIGIEDVIIVKTNGRQLVAVQREDLDLDDPATGARELAYYDNRTGEADLSWNPDVVLADFEAGAVDFSQLWNEAEWSALLEGFGSELLGRNGAGGDAAPQIDRAAELQAVWGTKVGQVWRLGEHRLAVGDCTDKAVVEAVMRGERAVLCHADPPYGMGKEKDGIANDNLYNEKLDAFQVQWWRAGRPYLEDNASAYIWGNADDLWRLWYIGGLRDSERLTFRNEITWDKGFAQQFALMTEGNSVLRSYNPVTERCLFFMLGEQGFNNNADNYWDGWEPIREYLYNERVKMGWDVPTMKRLVGHSDLSRDHWTSKSQWNFPTLDVYQKLQKAANGKAFKRDYDELKRDYDELKRDFYATRAYFDNTHDNMTDVWQYPRVQGDERWGHATPKPTVMIERIVKSSSPDGAIVYSPFLGSGTDLIACENLTRRCRAIEIDPAYAAVSLQRWADATSRQPERVSG